jgi:competence protein ComEC
LSSLAKDLAGAPIDLVWITHPHSDHLGGAPELLERFVVRAWVDNGRDLDRPTVARARAAAEGKGVHVRVAAPGAPFAPLAPETPGVRVTPVLPAAWPKSCDKDANDCSIALRVDYCASSVLFVGDAEAEEEALLDPGPVTLLQVGHHGSDTSTSPAFLAKTTPRYAVISSGRPGEGMNATYCHPRRATVERLAHVVSPDAPGGTLRAFDGGACKGAGPEAWRDVPVPGSLWATARDGDVVLVTRGDGTFVRE